MMTEADLVKFDITEEGREYYAKLAQKENNTYEHPEFGTVHKRLSTTEEQNEFAILDDILRFVSSGKVIRANYKEAGSSRHFGKTIKNLLAKGYIEETMSMEDLRKVINEQRELDRDKKDAV